MRASNLYFQLRDDSQGSTLSHNAAANAKRVQKSHDSIKMQI
jgi:hypothetical protein